MMRKKEEEERKISANPFHYYQPPRTDHMGFIYHPWPQLLSNPAPPEIFFVFAYHKKADQFFFLFLPP
jgi:hypothetical protein